MNDWNNDPPEKLDPLAELPPACCGYPMDEDMGGWTCLRCGHHFRPYLDDGPGPSDEFMLDAYAPPPEPPPQCPHGIDWGAQCDMCDHLGDLALRRPRGRRDFIETTTTTTNE